jgi:hypothetical protein
MEKCKLIIMLKEEKNAYRNVGKNAICMKDFTSRQKKFSMHKDLADVGKSFGSV